MSLKYLGETEGQYHQRRILEKNKNLLAEKVKTGVKLSKEEKEFIYRLLTGFNMQASKRGARPKKLRDMKLALIFLRNKIDGIKYGQIIETLFKECPEITDETTLEKAYNRGIKALREHAKSIIDVGDPQKTLLAKYHLLLIEHHEMHQSVFKANRELHALKSLKKE